MNINELQDYAKEIVEKYIIEKYFNLTDVEVPLFEIQCFVCEADWHSKDVYNQELRYCSMLLSATILDNKVYRVVYDRIRNKITFNELSYKIEETIQIDI